MGADPQTAVPLERTLDGVLGFEFLETGEEEARARFTVGDRHRQPMGLVHGGAYAALAESLCSASTHIAVSPDSIAVGQSNLTTFTRPVSEGAIDARARRRHRGRTTWVWEVDFTDQHGRLCATTRVTMAVRPAA
ncbi:MAG: PaaI family thioesterase [Actinomycetota bacterium]|nr:PaaI family thioesterase [Actinomycetota bacterium]